MSGYTHTCGKSAFPPCKRCAVDRAITTGPPFDTPLEGPDMPDTDNDDSMITQLRLALTDALDCLQALEEEKTAPRPDIVMEALSVTFAKTEPCCEHAKVYHDMDGTSPYPGSSECSCLEFYDPDAPLIPKPGPEPKDRAKKAAALARVAEGTWDPDDLVGKEITVGVDPAHIKPGIALTITDSKGFPEGEYVRKDPDAELHRAILDKIARVANFSLEHDHAGATGVIRLSLLDNVYFTEDEYNALARLPGSHHVPIDYSRTTTRFDGDDSKVFKSSSIFGI